jgi:hypothetical protein
MPIKFLLKGGVHKVLTFSYDDGNYEGDKQLIGIFNKYGLKASFHLNGQNYAPGGWAWDKIDELKELYRGHEVSMHGYTHPFLERLPKEEVIDEMQKDRKSLEAFAGYPVRGMSYPYGTYSETVLDVLEMLDIKYSRTTHATNGFSFPENYLTWHPTMHHNGGVMEKLEQFKSYYKNEISMLYIWGHSYEFNHENPVLSWEGMEEFCKQASKLEDTWFATNIEIYDYMTAAKRIEISADRKMFVNPSAISVWIDIEGKAYELKPGVTKI